MSFREEKITNHIRELAATFIEREASGASMITVTRVHLAVGGKHATIYVSVLPIDKENAAFGFLKRNLGEMRTFIQSRLKIHPIPFFEVEIDQGEKNRQKIDDLLRNG
ncbi:MAG: ribosome-binding factor [Patescibacteria group bacterium]|jgi:ribosome-binding factor A|nr:ribosome-binding factor [Patescibacteria group bacterium]